MANKICRDFFSASCVIATRYVSRAIAWLRCGMFWLIVLNENLVIHSFGIPELKRPSGHTYDTWANILRMLESAFGNSTQNPLPIQRKL
jgi:hypothetical protein